MSWFSGLLGAGSTLLGDVVGNLIDADQDKDAEKRQRNHDYTVMQNQIQWKVEDAKKAGLHPLAVLGASTYSPSQIVGGGSNRWSNLGQSVGRAAEAYLSKDERAKKDVLDNLAIERAGLENQLLKAQTTSVQRSTNPPAPNSNSKGIGAVSGDVAFLPSENTSSRPDKPYMDANRPSPAFKEYKMPDGSVVLWPNPDAKAAIEDSLYEFEHMYHGRYKPWVPKTWAYRQGRNLANFVHFTKKALRGRTPVHYGREYY